MMRWPKRWGRSWPPCWDADGVVDPVLGQIQGTTPGLPLPLLHFAYEGLAWCGQSARRPRAQGVVLRERLDRAHRTVLDAAGYDEAGAELTARPSPEALLAATELSGLKLHRLHGIPRAALDGRLAETSCAR